MAAERLRIHTQPRLDNGQMILAFSGWMDGGNVSTGTVDWLTAALGAQEVGTIDPEGFYIYNFPGAMEISALFRPYAQIQDGALTALLPPENTLWCSVEQKLVLFRGKEPNFNWREFAECIFSFASAAGVTALTFIGSVAGAVPHTREPRFFATVSEESLKPALSEHGVNFTNYEGPASFATQLLSEARNRGVHMVSLVAEIPAYMQGPNPKSIEATVRMLAAILGLHVPLGDLRTLSTAWEERLSEVLGQKPELTKHILKLEEDYDNEVFDTQMGDLKEWLVQHGIRVD
jgi:predicted ATP-grasp superfamily ATP-dependent carboligase